MDFGNWEKYDRRTVDSLRLEMSILNRTKDRLAGGRVRYIVDCHEQQVHAMVAQRSNTPYRVVKYQAVTGGVMHSHHRSFSFAMRDVAMWLKGGGGCSVMPIEVACRDHGWSVCTSDGCCYLCDEKYSHPGTYKFLTLSGIRQYYGIQPTVGTDPLGRAASEGHDIGLPDNVADAAYYGVWWDDDHLRIE